MPSSIYRPQSLKRRRVGVLILGGIAVFQLVLPGGSPNGGNTADSALAVMDWAPAAVGVFAIMLGILVGAFVMNRRRPVCDQIIAKWRALDTNGDGGVDKAEFEAGTAKIFGDRKIEFAELTYLHGLIKRLDVDSDKDGRVTQEELSAGLHKVMTLIGGKPVETVGDLCDALKKLSDAANAPESDAIEAEVVKEMSQKSMSRRSLSQKSLSQKSLSGDPKSASQKSVSQKSMSQKSVTGTDRDIAA